MRRDRVLRVFEMFLTDPRFGATADQPVALVGWHRISGERDCDTWTTGDAHRFARPGATADCLGQLSEGGSA